MMWGHQWVLSPRCGGLLAVRVRGREAAVVMLLLLVVLLVMVMMVMVLG